jgi:hypothetical protein
MSNNAVQNSAGNAQPCPLCGDLPPSLTAQTGIDERFPEAVYALKRLNIDRDEDLYRCPECDSLFRWEDRPQFYGSGNLDEEILTRLSKDEAAVLRALLDLESNFESAAPVVKRAFEIGPAELVNRILMRLAIYKPAEFASLVDVLVRRLIHSNDSAIGDVLTTYCGRDPMRIAGVIARLEADSRAKNSFVKSTLTLLRERIKPEPSNDTG